MRKIAQYFSTCRNTIASYTKSGLINHTSPSWLDFFTSKRVLTLKCVILTLFLTSVVILDVASARAAGGPIRGLDGKCLDVWEANSTDGTRIVLWPCHDGANQQWEFRSDGTIQGLGGKCLDVWQSNSNDGTDIVLWPCHAGPNQRWALRPDGTIQGLGGKCLDVWEANSTDGTRIVLWPCHGGPNQRWSASSPETLGQIKLEYEQPASGDLPPKPSLGRTKINSDGSVIGITQGPLAGVPDKMWNPGETLKVNMQGGTENVRLKVRQFAEEWTKYANIKFQFVKYPDPAHIRITFRKGGSWSAIGRDAVTFPFNLGSSPTMNFGWFDDNTSDAEIRRVTLHEFGHALGLIHEHQSPAAGIAWDKEKVYEWYKQEDPPWDRNGVDQNVFKRYSVSSTNYSEYDPDSIMHYPIPAQLTLDGYGTGWNTTLSATDKKYIAKWYPFPGADSGQLRTNDDCDQIDFRVEYGVEQADKVRFELKPGSTVTWWKAIKIPIGSNKYEQFDMQDGASSYRLLDKTALDSSRPIRFAKAKIFGIHTLLGYTWDVMSALPGGSRVTLKWVNDHCR